MAGCAQFTKGEDIGSITHSSTLVPTPAGNRGKSSGFAHYRSATLALAGPGRAPAATASRLPLPPQARAGPLPLRLVLMTGATPPVPSAQPSVPPAAPKGTLLLLVRHGETPTTGMILPGRAPGLHLSERGRAQAEQVAERLAGLPISGIYSSPLERTLETAGPTASRTGLAVNGDAGLIECDFGDWTGRPLAELAALPQWQDVQHSPSAFRFPSGESFPEMQERMVGALEVLRATHPGGVVVCFSHADPLKAAVAHALGMPLDLFQRIVISPGSVSAISYDEGRAPAVLMVNSTSESLRGLRAP
jgi:probable phosphomutase (TIGR03848 family)